jgi:TonB-dependent receptor
VNSTCTTCLVYTPVTASKSDTQWLPSFNLRLAIIRGLYLRADASKTVTRPTFAQLNPGLTYSAATATLLGTATSGNANLTPVKSTNFDLDLTYYWGTGNHIGASAFYRHVEGYIQTIQTNIVYQGLNYILSQPQNAQTANIKGVEGGYSQFLDFLPGFLSGFGFDTNATYIEAPFYNVAKFHLNASGIYEKGPYSFRLSYTYNSPYKIAAFATGAQPQFTYASVRTNMDFSANYRFSDRLTATFDATNLLDSYQREHAGDGDQNALLFPTNLARYDRTFAIGVRVKL